MQNVYQSFKLTYVHISLKDTWKSTDFPDNTIQNDTVIYGNMTDFQLLISKFKFMPITMVTKELRLLSEIYKYTGLIQ